MAYKIALGKMSPHPRLRDFPQKDGLSPPRWETYDFCVLARQRPEQSAPSDRRLQAPPSKP